MLDFEEALDMALERREVDYYLEFEKAFIFRGRNDLPSIGGDGMPVLIDRVNGCYTNYLEIGKGWIDNENIIAEGDVEERLRNQL